MNGVQPESSQEAAMLSISHALDRIKGRVTDAVPVSLIERLCRDVGHSWRNRDLGPVVTTHLFLTQVLHGNTAISHLRHLSGLDFTPAAYCQARNRLPLAFFHRLQHAVSGRLERQDAERPETRWLGHRVFLLDGSSFSMPDTDSLREYFGQPDAQAEGCGFPVAHLLTRFDARRGYLLKSSACPYATHDMSQAAAMHAELAAGDVLVGDRAFASYAHLALCKWRNVHGLFRAHQKQIIDFRPGREHLPPHTSAKGHAGMPRSRWLRRLGPRDQLVEYFKPDDRPEWMTAEQYASLPESIVVRELRYKIRCPGCRTQEVTLVTTLLDPDIYSAAKLARLYGLRWTVETDLRHLKETMKMDVLHCKTVEGVQKELAIFAVIYNLVRRVMEEASQRQQVPVERISFVDALRWLRQARPGDELPKLIVNPDRPGRVQPRVRKRRPKPYPLMTRPRAQLIKKLFRQRRAA
jgi:hypothetical protein